jgi:uncharacterized membrane protein (DUF4010 family)
VPVEWPAFLDLGVALAIGFVLGLQRERSRDRRRTEAAAGVRTFSLLALLGGVSGLLPGAPWPSVAALAVVGAFVLVAYLRAPRGARGLTTEVLAILTLVLGALATSGRREVAAVVGGAALVLASLKGPLHGLAGRLTDADETATIKFVAVALLVLPFLPDRGFGPHEAVNPFEIGRMAVLVAGVSFVGYVLVKTVGPRAGILLSGVLGGIASSTATTASLARRSRTEPALAPVLAAATVAACTVLFPRVLFLVSVTSAAFLPEVVPPVAAMGVVSISVGLLVARGRRGLAPSSDGEPTLRNPFELAPALWFALLYGAVAFAARVLLAWLGAQVLLGVAAASGIVDVDAIALTLSGLHARDAAETSTLARALVLALAVNGVAKSALAASMGSAKFAWRTVPALLAASAVGVGWVFFAPLP